MKTYLIIIYNWFKTLFKKHDLDKIFERLDLPMFYGQVGKEIHYHDNVVGTHIFTILVKNNDIKIITSSARPDYVEKIGILELRRSERIVFYQRIEDYMIKMREIEENKLKRALLYGLGLTENQFAYLVNNCKDPISN